MKIPYLENLIKNLPADFNFNLNIGKYSFPTSYLQAGVLIFLLFILVLTLASVRRHFVDWSAKGALFGLFFGFLLALLLEGFLIIGGKTAITEILGWKNAPQPILHALDLGRDRLSRVLGMTDSIPNSSAEVKKGWEELVGEFQNLTPAEAEKVRSQVCVP